VSELTRWKGMGEASAPVSAAEDAKSCREERAASGTYIPSGVKYELAALALAVPLGGVVQQAAVADSYIQECSDAWADSPASGFCTTAVFGRDPRDNDGNAGDCRVNASCSITVTINTNPSRSQTWAITLNRVLAKDDMDDVDFCFAASDASTTGYLVSSGVGCSAGQTASSVATSAGLPDPNATASSSE